jgi:hypothetical protein
VGGSEESGEEGGVVARFMKYFCVYLPGKICPADKEV